MGNFVGPALPELSSEEEASVLALDCSVNSIVKYIQEGRAKKIVLMVGAGISVSAGIPDFRTPGSGLYDNLQKYNLPKPEAMFDIEFFRNDPRPFYDLARELLPTNFTPTPTHFFIKLLQEKGLLSRCYTQNIDTLERRAGVNPELLVEAHGSFGSAHCTSCGRLYSLDYFKEKITTMSDKRPNPVAAAASTSGRGINQEKSEAMPEFIPWCKCELTECGGNVKPDIVFFGEGLPARFHTLRESDLQSADLLIVMGTSLAVAPFCNTMHLTNVLAPRLLINRERVGMVNWMTDGHGFKFDRRDNYRDVELLGSCDDNVRTLCDQLGWRTELEALISAFHSNTVTVAAADPPFLAPIAVDPVVLARNQRVAADAPMTAEELVEQQEAELALSYQGVDEDEAEDGHFVEEEEYTGNNSAEAATAAGAVALAQALCTVTKGRRAISDTDSDDVIDFAPTTTTTATLTVTATTSITTTVSTTVESAEVVEK